MGSGDSELLIWEELAARGGRALQGWRPQSCPAAPVCAWTPECGGGDPGREPWSAEERLV